MKKILLSIVLTLSVMISFSSCVTPVYSQDVVVEGTANAGGVDISVIISAGTPYYFEGSLLYYLYNGWYYYPYYYNNRVYYYRYSRPFATYHGYRFVPERHQRPYGFRNMPPPAGRHGNTRPGRSSTYETAPRPRPNGSTHSVTPRTNQRQHGGFTPRPNTPSRSGGNMTPNRGSVNRHGNPDGRRR